MTKERLLAELERLSRKIETTETSLEAWKWQRAEKMAAAADAGATQREIGQAAGLVHKAVQRHLAVWRRYVAIEPKPSYSEAFDAATGFDREEAQARTDRARTRRTLEQAPLEQVEQIVASLPKERQQALAAAAGSEYHKARQDYDEAEAALTPTERNERDLAQEQITRPARQATATFTTLGIVGHLEQALEELRELNADASVSPDAARKIEQALDAFVTEFNFARAMLGERTDA